MKSFHKTIIASTLAVALAASASMTFAKGQSEERDPTQRFNYIFTQLELSESQQTQVIEILQATAEAQREAMWDQKKALRDSEDRPTQEEIQALRETQRAAQLQLITDELNTVLSPEVTEELVEYLDAHKTMGKQGKRGGKGGERGPGGESSRN